MNEELENTHLNLQKKVVQLDALSQYLHSILTHISQGLLFVDLDGIITTYNKAAETLLEIDHLDILFNNFWAFFSDEIFGFSIRKALKERSYPPTIFTVITTPSGKQKEIEVNTSFVFKALDKSKEPFSESIELIQGLVILIRDFTYVKHLQTSVHRNRRMKELGEIAARVAHEIRNPLGGIKGFASLLKRDLETQKELQQMAEYIIEGTDSLNRIVTNILTYSHPVNPSFVPTDLVWFLVDLEKHVRVDSAFGPHVHLEIKSGLAQIIAPADPLLLKSAFLNLVLNAIQALPKEGGTITITIEQKNEEAIISVHDTGMGIAQENLGKLFLPLFTTKPEGNGLGLAEVDKVIQAHGGTISAASEVGKGSVFTVTLPLKLRN